MKTLVTVCVALATWLGALPLASAATRRALVVGTNRGLADEPVLQFAESDARAMAETFVEVGAVDASRVTTLLGRPLSEVQSALVHIAGNVHPDDEVWVFLSGHADTRGVHVRGDVWNWKALRAALDSISVSRLLVFVDACNSGALLTAKGITVDAPLRVSLQSSVKGRAILASSGANELSYESRRLSGSPFAHFVASGLRGAADEGDGKVTLPELYRYLYSRTVAASLGGAAGPQHPAHGDWYRGSGEWWLTEKSPGSGDLVLRDTTLGPCYVLDASETRVLGEVRASDPGALSLPPGSYRVKCRSTDGMLAATLNLASGRADLDELPFETAQEELVLARGPSEVARHSIGVWFGPRFDPELRSAVSVSYQRRRHGLGLGASVGAVATKQWTAQGELLAALPWWNADVVALEVGLLVGVESRFDARGSSLALGPLVQLSTPLSSTLRLSLREEMTRTIPLDDSAAPTLPLTTRLGLSLDL